MASGQEMAVAVFPFQAQEEGDLGFENGTEILIMEKDPSGWWTGRNLRTNKVGDFPYNYVKIVTADELKAKATKQKGAQSKGDLIKSITVRHDSALTTAFTVTLTTDKSKKISGTKTLTDFRTLDDDIKAVLDKTATLPPIWADKYTVTEALTIRRCRVLEAYFRSITSSQNALADYVIADWLKKNNSSFNASADLKAEFQAKIVSTRAKRGRASMNMAFANVRPLAYINYDWAPKDAVELEMVKGETIAIINKITQSDGWWEGETADGQKGLFPSNYVKPLSPTEARNIVLGASKPVPKVPEPEPVGLGKSKSKGSGEKKTEANFVIPTFEGFDQVLSVGFTLVNGKNNFKSKQQTLAKEGDIVSLSYTAYVFNCQTGSIYEFASSDSLENMKFSIGKGDVVEALELAVQYMGEGDSCRVVVRPDLGYGEVGKPPEIAPNVHLVYDIKLDEISGMSLPPPPSMTNTGPTGSFSGNTMDDLAGAFAEVSTAGTYNNNAWKPIHERQQRKHHAPGNSATAPTSAPPSIPAAPPSGAPGQPRKFSLKKLQEIVRTRTWEQHQVDPSFVENHLADSDFLRVFNCSLEKFTQLPRWKQMKLRKDAHLYI